MKNDELPKLGKALTAIVFVLWGAFPMLVLGWLVAAIGRHPTAEAAIKNEAVYSFLLFWKGGTASIVPMLLIIFFLVALMIFSFFARKHGYSHSHDGLASARSFIQKFAVPSFLSASAFAIGLLSKESLSGLLSSLWLLIAFGVFMAIVNFIADITKRVN